MSIVPMLVGDFAFYNYTGDECTFASQQTIDARSECLEVSNQVIQLLFSQLTFTGHFFRRVPLRQYGL
jgi:hypothetical protein